MTKTTTLPWEEAYPIARRVYELLRPYCLELRIAGSIRRLEDTVKSIEIVCLPRRNKDLFNNDTQGKHPGWKQAVMKLGEVVEGDAESSGYIKIHHYSIDGTDPLAIDLFIADKYSYYPILVSRTGDEEFASDVIEKRLKSDGFVSIQGKVSRLDDGYALMFSNEKDVFDTLGLPYVQPYQREFRDTGVVDKNELPIRTNDIVLIEEDGEEMIGICNSFYLIDGDKLNKVDMLIYNVNDAMSERIQTVLEPGTQCANVASVGSALTQDIIVPKDHLDKLYGAAEELAIIIRHRVRSAGDSLAYTDPTYC